MDNISAINIKQILNINSYDIGLTNDNQILIFADKNSSKNKINMDRISSF